MAKKEPVVTVDEAKRWLRRALIRKRQLIKPSGRKALSQKAINNLINTSFYKRSRNIALFLGFGSELMTLHLVDHAWKKGKRVLVPMTTKGLQKPFFAVFKKGDALKRTSFGPLELTQAKKTFNFRSIDLVIVPGLGYDARCHRLGYGGGVYDRVLAKTPRATHAGLFFGLQQLRAVPTAGHDRPMHAIVTENGVLSAHGTP